MSRSTIPTRSSLGDRLALAAWRAARPLRRLARTWAARRQEARDLAQIELLDACALRDLGLGRSELRSIHAEALNRAEETRRRIAPSRAACPEA
jgi:uncharacterized protein YjiS (DUF1127 family)